MFWGDVETPFSHLVGFVLGFQARCSNEEDWKGFLDLGEFNPLVADHFGEEWPSARGWMMLIRENSSSEREAFDLFFHLRDKMNAKFEGKP